MHSTSCDAQVEQDLMEMIFKILSCVTHVNQLSTLFSVVWGKREGYNHRAE